MKDILKIDNFSKYEIYPKEGKIYSLRTKKNVGYKDVDGYWRCTLTSDNKTIWKTGIHRVIYTAVNGEIPQDMQVNHIDENPDNNNISNLNLMTPKENTNWGTRNKRASKTLLGKKCSEGTKQKISDAHIKKMVGAYKDGILQFTFSSTMECGKNGYRQPHIVSCCNGKRKTHKGYEWRYIE